MSVGYQHEDCHCHPWCSDPSRDEFIRAAEDGRKGRLPTLEEAIAAITQRGNDMATKAEIQAADYRAEATSERTEGVTERRPVDAGGGGNVTGRLRTERVTLSLARMGELIEERDAAIRERDEAKQHHARECAKCAALADKVIGLKGRVAELNAAAKLAPAANADGGSNHAAPAASGAAGTEAMAWGVRRKGGVDAVVHRLFRSSAEASAEQYGGTVVPLYAAPQAAPGWLTAEERGSIQHAANLAKASWSYSVAQELENILARSSPPEVVLPGRWKAVEQGHPERSWQPFIDQVTANRDAEWLAALAAAGVAVKEAG